MSSASGACDGQDVKAEAALVKPGWFSQGQRWLEQDFSLVLWVSHRFVYFFRVFFFLFICCNQSRHIISQPYMEIQDQGTIFSTQNVSPKCINFGRVNIKYTLITLEAFTQKYSTSILMVWGNYVIPLALNQTQ